MGLASLGVHVRAMLAVDRRHTPVDAPLGLSALADLASADEADGYRTLAVARPSKSPAPTNEAAKPQPNA